MALLDPDGEENWPQYILSLAQGGAVELRQGASVWSGPPENQGLGSGGQWEGNTEPETWQMLSFAPRGASDKPGEHPWERKRLSTSSRPRALEAILLPHLSGKFPALLSSPSSHRCNTRGVRSGRAEGRSLRKKKEAHGTPSSLPLTPWQQLLKLRREWV